ncbi:MAG TPA: hypothetical protein VNX47_06640 [Nevskia sp.]|jgi:hypothetical protein|nr:hypothetical protein [Nevskia sp.]
MTTPEPESLEHPSEREARQMWLREAQRRAEEIDHCNVQLVSAEELEQQVEALYK